MADCGGGWFTWDWIMKTRGITFFRGFDVVHLGDDGKYDFLAGFFDKRADPVPDEASRLARDVHAVP
jgi:hypothetical protein